MLPIIKYTGSKRSQAKNIVDLFPKKINTYYEPFIGGGSILGELLQRKDIIVDTYICSDINSDLINLWNVIKYTPNVLFDEYNRMWHELKVLNGEDKKQYYYQVRERLNKEHNPIDFFFITRTTTNGLIRYNKKGEFNNSFHFSRDGIKPENLKPILLEWSYLLNKYNVLFLHMDYKTIFSNKNDLMYLDPPYFNTKGMYFGNINYDYFIEWLSKQNASYLLSYDGIRGEQDFTYDIPKILYDEHIYLESGISSFNKLVQKENVKVYESLYIKRK